MQQRKQENYFNKGDIHLFISCGYYYYIHMTHSPTHSLIYLIIYLFRSPEKPTPSIDEMILTTRSQISKGLLRLYLSASQDEIIPTTPLHFNTPEIQFLSRYRSFYNISSPTPLQYSHYLSMIETLSQAQQTTNELIQTSLKCFKSIKDFMNKITMVHETNQANSSYSHSSLSEKEKLLLQEHSGLVKVMIFVLFIHVL